MRKLADIYTNTMRWQTRELGLSQNCNSHGHVPWQVTLLPNSAQHLKVKNNYGCKIINIKDLAFFYGKRLILEHYLA